MEIEDCKKPEEGESTSADNEKETTTEMETDALRTDETPSDSKSTVVKERTETKEKEEFLGEEIEVEEFFVKFKNL